MLTARACAGRSLRLLAQAAPVADRQPPVDPLPEFATPPPHHAGRPHPFGGELSIELGGSRTDVAMAETPSGADADVFRYYCPLCMLYFKSINRMSCCSEYVCDYCVAEYGKRHGIVLDSIAERSLPLALGMPCPCCSVTKPGITIDRVDPGEKPRSYDDSPRTKAMLPAITEQLQSPVRVGAGFEEMRRKMITFEAAGYRASQGDTVPAELPAVEGGSPPHELAPISPAPPAGGAPREQHQLPGGGGGGGGDGGEAAGGGGEHVGERPAAQAAPPAPPVGEAAPVPPPLAPVDRPHEARPDGREGGGSPTHLQGDRIVPLASPGAERGASSALPAAVPSAADAGPPRGSDAPAQASPPRPVAGPDAGAHPEHGLAVPRESPREGRESGHRGPAEASSSVVE